MSDAIERRAMMRTMLGAGMALPLLSPGSLLAASLPDPRLSNIHPEYRAFAENFLPYLDKMPPFTRETLPLHRQQMGSAMMGGPLPDVSVRKEEVAGSRGQPPVTVYVVNAGAQGARPAILHIHGGGFIVGSASSSIRPVQEMCKALDCVAVTVEYRLAPETTYKGSIEDNYAALKWLHDNASRLGVDPKRIAVYGESAGGGHAALLAITARDRGEVPVAFQCLVYPMLDDRTGSSRPTSPLVGQLLWTAASNRFGWESFLGMRPGTASVPKQAVPARQENLSSLPPAFIGVGSTDLFVDEDVDYAQRLNNAGVPAELIVVPGCFHGFDVMPVKTKIGTWFTDAKMNALRRGLGIEPV